MQKILAVLLIFAFSSVMGQEVVELKLPKSNKIIVKLMFKNGSVSDPKGKEGLTSLTSDLIMDGGTGEMTSSDIKEKIYPMSSEYYNTTDKEVTIFTFEFHKDFSEKFYPILKGLILDPSFKQEDFERIKRNQQNYVDQVIRNSSDEEYSKLLLENELFKGTPYQYPVTGTSAGVASITLDDVKQHYKSVFTQKNLTIGIAGNYTQDFLNRLKTDLTKLPETAPAITIAKPSMPDGINVDIIKKENTLGSAIVAGFPINVTRADNDFAALMVANSYLGEHRKSYSLLFDKIRTARSMNYGDYTYIEWYNNGGQNMLPPPGFPRSSNYFSIWIRPVQTATSLKKQYPELSNINVGHAHFALRLAVREVEKLVNNGMTQENFNLTREFLKSYIKLYVQTPERQLGFMIDSRFYGRKNYIEEMETLLSNLSVDDVNKALKKYFQVQNMDVAVVTDVTEAEPLSESLKSNAASPMSYSNALKETLPKEVLKEDEEIAKFPLNIKKVNILNSEETFK